MSPFSVVKSGVRSIALFLNLANCLHEEREVPLPFRLRYDATMLILRAATLGMCMGVRRADRIARETAARARAMGVRAFTFGPLIHNPQAIAELEALGIHVLDPEPLERGDLMPELQGALVVIRAHGASLDAIESLHRQGAEVIDATCPRVLASQKLARRYEERGWQVVLVGDRRHGEMQGILGHTAHAIVVDSVPEAETLARSLADRSCALIAQTTIREEEYAAVIETFRRHCQMVAAEQTICPATSERQQALLDLCRRVDAILVVGGRNSANTRRLFATARDQGMPSWHIETADEVVPEMVGFERIGITAGASTPDSIVEDVESRLASLHRTMTAHG